MKKVIYVIVFSICVTLLPLITNSPIILNAQPGWSDDQRLVFLPGGGWNPRAACCGDTVHLVWYQRYGYHEVFYKRSTDAGFAWEGDIRLSVEDNNSSIQPTVGINDNFVHVVWQEEHAGVCYRKSEDGGNTWFQIDTLPDAGLSQPWIHVDGYNLYVISVNANGMLVFTKSTDNGDTWHIGREITHSCGYGRIKKINPSLVLSHQDDPYSVEIYYLRSTDDGQTWSRPLCISQYDSISSFNPAMTIDDGGGIHINWCDYRYSPYSWTGDIFYCVSSDAGGNWEEIDSLTVMHRAVASDILAEGNDLHIVWEDDRHSFDNNFEIYYRTSTDLGETWMEELRLTNELYWSICPSLACGGEYLHLFWRDCRDSGHNGIGAIYYKRKDLSYSIEESNESAIAGYKFEIYPNPFSEMLNIKYMYTTAKAEIRIFDIYGREMAECMIKNQPEGLTVATRDLPCGVYFVQLDADHQRVMKKVVKIR